VRVEVAVVPSFDMEKFLLFSVVQVSGACGKVKTSRHLTLP